MEETNNKKNVKKTVNKDKKKIYLKRRIIALGILVLVIALIITLIVTLKPEKEREFAEAILANNYYIKMVEVDEEFKEKGEVLTVTRDGEDIAIHTDAQTLILKDEVFAQIFHKEKIITQYPKDSIVNNINIGINGFENNGLVETKQEDLNGKTYTCKVYKSGMKVYYDGEEVKYFVIDNGIGKVIEFEGKVNEDLFEFPEDYTVANQKE